MARDSDRLFDWGESVDVFLSGWIHQGTFFRHAYIHRCNAKFAGIEFTTLVECPDNALGTKALVKRTLGYQPPTRLINKTPTGLLLILRTGSVVGPKATVSIPKLSFTTARARIFMPTRRWFNNTRSAFAGRDILSHVCPSIDASQNKLIL